MDLLIVGAETTNTPATAREIDDPADARVPLASLPQGPLIADLLVRLAVGTLVLSRGLDRGASRAALGVAIQRSQPRGVVLLGIELGRELFGAAVPLGGAIRELHNRPVALIGPGKREEVERLLTELCLRAHVTWAPPSARAAAARTVVRAEEAESQAALLIERKMWSEAVATLRAAEPLGARGTNMLGRALLELGDRPGARHAFERTLAGDPGNQIAQRQLSQFAPR